MSPPSSRKISPGRQTTHDFLSERKWLSTISGFADSATVVYSIYRVLMVSTMLYIQVSAVWACILEPRKKLIVDAVHFMLVALFTFWCFGVRIVVSRSLSDTRDFLKNGIYLYEDEDEVILRMKEQMPLEIRRKSNLFIYMFVAGAFTNSTLFPISQLVLLEPKDEKGVTNPYLPHLYHQPFNTRSTRGMLIGYLIGIAYYFFVYTISCTTIWYYLSGVVQLKVHFRVLNYSIANIQKRAVAMYSSMRSLRKAANFEEDIMADFFSDRQFHNCIYRCFRANVQHHQALLMLRKKFEPFSGCFALAVFSLASMVYGCLLYLMYQEHPINVYINLFLAFSAEQFTVIFICFLGEDVLQESEKIFHRLYTVSWFNYDRKSNQILHIMMSNCLKPIGIKALMFGVPASFETYGQVVSAMYKVMSLVRQSDIM